MIFLLALIGSHMAATDAELADVKRFRATNFVVVEDHKPGRSDNIPATRKAAKKSKVLRYVRTDPELGVICEWRAAPTVESVRAARKEFNRMVPWAGPKVRQLPVGLR